MKKLINLLIISVLLASCGYYENGKTAYPIIDKIEPSSNQKIVVYHIDNSPRNFNIIWFCDSIGKYSIGDTVKFTK